ncbi:MAG: WhiB family transcriptional regulator [Candidatus Saccharimonadales bacterium]
MVKPGDPSIKPTLSPEDLPDAGWSFFAACRGEDTEMFFPESLDTDPHNVLKILCRHCTVIDDCLEREVAQEGSLATSISGGLLPQQRRDLRAERQKLTDEEYRNRVLALRQRNMAVSIPTERKRGRPRKNAAGA